MLRTLFFVLFFLLASCISSENNIIQIFEKQGDFKNLRVLRVVDLRKSVVKEDIGIRAKITAKEATNVYYFVLPAAYMPFVASYQAHLKQGTKDQLVMESIGLDSSQKMNVYKIHLNQTLLKLQPDQDVKIGVQIVYTHLVRPLPEKIPQISKQHVSFTNNIYFFTAYPTTDMKTTFIFPSSSIVTFGGGESENHTGKMTDNKLIYGVFNNIKPLSLGQGNFHYEYQPPILTITKLEREMEISHWATNLAVEEHYALRHDGAQLDQEFNRIKYQMPPNILQQTNVLNKLVFQFPKNAHGVYYRDEVGNVSTSNYHQGLLEIQPRFPLFGGWKTTWYMGYHVPLKDFVRQCKGQQYILKVQFVENVGDNMAVDDLKLKVILPEGATDIQVTPPTTFDIDSIGHSVHYTYFDSTGRPAITFQKKNVVSAHQQPVLIAYRYSSIKLLQKPLVVSGILFLLCLSSIAISKIPWALNNDDLEESEEEEEEVMMVKRPLPGNKKIAQEVFPKGVVLVDESPTTTRKKPLASAVAATATSVKGSKYANSRKKSKKGQ